MAAFAAEVRSFLQAHARRAPEREDFVWGMGDDRVAYFSTEAPEVESARVEQAREWQRTRYENGFGWITGPAQYGGRDLTPVHDMLYDAIESEYDTPDTGTLSVVGLGMIGPTILVHGQQPAKDRWLPAMYRGEAIACQLFSEPDAGSDLASVTTRAVRNGGRWTITGQKVWTSVAQHSQIGLALTRTDPDAPKHRGITAFLVPMDAPGVEVRPLRQMTGGADFNEVFLTEVEVPDENRLGAVGEGWTVALTTLMNERATVGNEGAGPIAAALSPQRLAGLMRAAGTLGDGALRARLAELLVDVMATGHLNARAMRELRGGVAPGPEMSVSKLMYAQNLTRAAHFVTDVLGARAIADTGVEKLKDSGMSGLVGTAVPGAGDDSRGEITAPANFSLIAPAYAAKYGLAEEELKEVLARIAWKNHANGARNPRAQYRSAVPLARIRSAPIVAGMLGVFDCSGVSDGAAAAIVVRAEDAAQYTDKPLFIKALSLVAGPAGGVVDPGYDFTTFPEVVASARDAYRQAGIADPRAELALAEVHDCFTPTELVLMEDLGFAARGQAWKDVSSGVFDLDGALPVNPDGGLKAFGHPIGASGLRMMYEAWLQLRQEAPPERAVRTVAEGRKLALTHNLGGGPGECVSFVSVVGSEPHA